MLGYTLRVLFPALRPRLQLLRTITWQRTRRTAEKVLSTFRSVHPIGVIRDSVESTPMEEECQALHPMLFLLHWSQILVLRWCGAHAVGPRRDAHPMPAVTEHSGTDSDPDTPSDEHASRQSDSGGDGCHAFPA